MPWGTVTAYFCTLLGRAGICTCSVEEGPDPWGTMTMVSWPSSDAWNCWPGPTPAGTVTAKVCIIGLLAPGRDIVYGHPRHVRQEAAREACQRALDKAPCETDMR